MGHKEDRMTLLIVQGRQRLQCILSSFWNIKQGRKVWLYMGGGVYINIHHKINYQLYQLSSTINCLQLIMAAAAASTSTSSWTLKKLVTNNEPTLICWLQTRHLLESAMTCPKCGSQCRLVRWHSAYSWRCPSKTCQTIKSISFFARSHPGLDIIVEAMYLWSEVIIKFTSYKAATQYHYDLLLPLYTYIFLPLFRSLWQMQLERLGRWWGWWLIGSIFLGMFVPNISLTTQLALEGTELWWRLIRVSLGATEGGWWMGDGRGTTKSFMVVVDDRSAATLIPIIQHYIWPGTLIMSLQHAIFAD